MSLGTPLVKALLGNTSMVTPNRRNDHDLVVDSFSRQSGRSCFYAVLMILVGMSIYLAFITSSMPIAPLLVAGVLIMLLISDYWLIVFRVRNGFYGYNRMEAEEITRFLIQQAKGGTGSGEGKLGVLRQPRPARTTDCKNDCS